MTRDEQARAHFQAACKAMSERPGDEWAVMAQRVDTLQPSELPDLIEGIRVTVCDLGFRCTGWCAGNLVYDAPSTDRLCGQCVKADEDDRRAHEHAHGPVRRVG